MKPNIRRMATLFLAASAMITATSCGKDNEENDGNSNVQLDISSADNRLSMIHNGRLALSPVLTSFVWDGGRLSSVSNSAGGPVWQFHYTDGKLSMSDGGERYAFHCDYDDYGRLVLLVNRDSTDMKEGWDLYFYDENRVELSYNSQGEVYCIRWTDSRICTDCAQMGLPEGYASGRTTTVEYEWASGNIIKSRHTSFSWAGTPGDIQEDNRSVYTVDQIEYDTHPNPLAQLPMAALMTVDEVYLFTSTYDGYALCKNNVVKTGDGTAFSYEYKSNGYPVYRSGGTANGNPTYYEYDGMLD